MNVISDSKHVANNSTSVKFNVSLSRRIARNRLFEMGHKADLSKNVIPLSLHFEVDHVRLCRQAYFTNIFSELNSLNLNRKSDGNNVKLKVK